MPRTHRMTNTPTYLRWKAMNGRTGHDPYYQGRITVCERWRSFANFLADMGERPPGTSLERIDNSKGYSPSNCRWATHKEQMRNTRSNIWIIYNGQRLCLTDACVAGGINLTSIYWRIKAHGITYQEAFDHYAARS